MAVPNIFGSATSAIPLSQLDQNFATAITLGNTAVYLGNTTTSLGNVTLTNVTISSGNVSVSTATVGAGSNTAPSITTTGDTNTGIFFPAADTIAFSEGGVESMRIDSSGQLGIGSISPAGKLTVKTGTNENLNVLTGGGGDMRISALNDAANTTVQLSVQASPLLFRGVGGAETARIDASGNMGLGVTPSALASGYKGFEINVVGNALTSSGSILNLSTNAIRGTNFTYGVTSPASLYQQSSGTHVWYTAPSGTAGNTISFTQAMTLDANGRLFVNTTTEPGSNDSVVVIKAGGTSKSRSLSLEAVTTGSVIVQTFRNPNGEVGYIATNGSATQYSTSSDYRLKESIQLMTGGLAKVAALKPCTYKWKSDGSDGQGFIAHELQEVYPDAVIGEKDGEEMQGVDYGKLTPILTAALQEAIAKIETLEARIAVLEAK
jgi:hypothetical protein